MSFKLFLSVLMLYCAGTALAAVSSQYKSAVKARINGDYAVVVFADGGKSLVPLNSLRPDDRAWLIDLSSRNPLAAGKSKMVVVTSTDEPLKAKKTVEVSKVEGPLETVQLCAPNVIQNQIGGTCMMYARVHWLDIAGYYVKKADVYKLINVVPSTHPWQDPRYVEGLRDIVTGFNPKPVVHRLPLQSTGEPFEWARAELRKGRPILAAFPREIWQDLPPGFIAKHPWNGGPVGHQIVINGFTWNSQTRSGTFHIINSWEELPQFELPTEAAEGALVIEQSLSPVGEPQAAAAKEMVQNVVLIKSIGQNNLYEVQTNVGTRRVVAPDEDAARAAAESDQ